MTELRPTFDDVLTSAREGSPWALGWLYRRFQPGLLRVLAVIAPHRADDMASDVWIEAARNLSRFSGDEPAFRGWLAAVARHRVIETSRRPARLRARAPEERGADQATSDAFAAQVTDVLSPDQADVVLLRVAAGLDVGGGGPGTGQGAGDRPHPAAPGPPPPGPPAGLRHRPGPTEVVLTPLVEDTRLHASLRAARVSQYSQETGSGLCDISRKAAAPSPE
ncbi:MAG: RNA polymerase sigma factor [Acidimicrobiales bacterium]